MAVLGTGVDPRHPDLAGSVTTGPDFSGSGRTRGGPFWGINGTEVAGAIAGHGHGTGRADGLLGVAPAAKILSIRVSLEFNDPLNSDRAIARRLPGAIASGIIYAVDHGARIIDLPLDPGTAGLTGQGNPAAAGGSPAEQAAVAYALRKNVVLVAPAGDDGQGPDLTDYPAAYPGVIAVGAIARNGQARPVQQPALVRVADRPRRRPDRRGPARRLRADQLHQHVQRHRGRRGRPHPVPVPAPVRGPGRPGADRGHDRRLQQAGPAHRAPGAAPSTPPRRSAWPPPSAPRRNRRRPAATARPSQPDSACRPRRRTGRTPATWPARWSGTWWPACAC